jgi:hypothetical protein
MRGEFAQKAGSTPPPPLTGFTLSEFVGRKCIAVGVRLGEQGTKTTVEVGLSFVRLASNVEWFGWPLYRRCSCLI